MTKQTKDCIQARDLLMDIVKCVRRDTDELQQDEIINPLESAIYALQRLI